MKKSTPWLVLGAACLLLLAPAALDFIPLRASGLSNTVGAVTGVFSLMVTIFLVDRFAKMRQEERDRSQFRELSRIAYRSLSQCVNDVGRRILGPIAGIDLHQAGIPGIGSDQVGVFLSRLEKANMAPLTVNSGFWNSLPVAELADRIPQLLADPSFANEQFRFTSQGRRELQLALADWAPVMVLDPDANSKLQEGWPLLDALVVLAEAWRDVSGEGQRSNPETVEHVKACFVRTVRHYRTWLESLQVHADLPTRGSSTREEDWKADPASRSSS